MAKNNDIPSEAFLISSLIVGCFKLWYSGVDQVFWLMVLIFAVSLAVSVQKRL